MTDEQTTPISTPAGTYMRSVKAAEQLGVEVELIEGLVSGGKLAGVKQRNDRGNWVVMVECSAVRQLQSRLR